MKILIKAGIKMRSYDLRDSICSLFKVKQPLYIWGAPGVGKSQIVKQSAEKLGVELRDVRAVLLDPVDLRGLPKIESDNKTIWSAPGFLPDKGEGILFLDELNAAPPLVQAACYQLILDRRIGEYELPDGWFVVAAGNRETDRAVTSRISSALANRFTHIEFEVNIDDWVSWALKNNIKEEVIAFIKFRPNLLHDFDPKRDEKGFPTPRSWEFVSDILNSGVDNKLLYELISGTIGGGAAAEFIGFLKIFRQVPDIDALLDNKISWFPPNDEPALLYAVSQVVASKADSSKIGAVMDFASKMPKEFEVLVMRDAVKKDKTIVDTEFFSNWAVNNSEVFI